MYVKGSGAERVLAKIEIGYEWEEEACWEFAGARGYRGHGQVKVDGAMRLAHRVVYEALVGPIPEGLELHHLCENPPCVNPTHLRPMTRQEHGSQHSRDVCPRGHALTPDNIVPDKNKKRGPGAKRCLECHRAYMRERWRKMTPEAKRDYNDKKKKRRVLGFQNDK